MTMLVVDSFRSMQRSSDVVDNMLQIPAVLACFAILTWIWALHYRFFRRYGLEDGYTIFLNAALLFVVMVFVYPLKFLFTFVVGHQILRLKFIDERTGEAFVPLAREHGLLLMQIYSGGFVAIFLLLTLVVRHAYRQREALELRRC